MCDALMFFELNEWPCGAEFLENDRKNRVAVMSKAGGESEF